mgnify:CR=1 FL=1
MSNECVICNGPIEVQKTPEGKVFWDKGHNAMPVVEGRCCTSCNHSVVIPARLGKMKFRHFKETFRQCLKN